MSHSQLNRVWISGVLREDPALIYFADLRARTTFKVVLPAAPAWSANESATEPPWLHVVAWDTLAETCMRHLHQDNGVFVQGLLRVRTWSDALGRRRRRVQIEATAVRLLADAQAGVAADPSIWGAVESDLALPF